MSTTDMLQLLGSGFMLGFAVLLAHIALNGGRFSSYGREALLSASGFITSIVAVRVVDLLNLLNPTDCRTINGLVAAVFLAILVQVVYGHWLCRRRGLLPNGRC